MRDRRRQIPEVEVLLRATVSKLNLLNSKMEALMIDVTKITAAATRANAGIESVLAVLAEQSRQLKDLSAQLAAAIAANDPAAQKAVQDQLDALAAGLDTESDKIAAATAAPPA